MSEAFQQNIFQLYHTPSTTQTKLFSIFLLACWSTCFVLILKSSKNESRIPSPFQHRVITFASSEIFPALEPQHLITKLKNPCWFEKSQSGRKKLSRQSYSKNPYYRMVSWYFHQLVSKSVERDNTTFKDARLRCAPYFYITGVPKCGTTELYHLLRTHPDILGRSQTVL